MRRRPEHDEELRAGDLGHIEYLLKGEMATHMGSIQEDRAFDRKANYQPTLKKYVDYARALRKVLRMKGHQTYVPVRDMHGATDWLDDELKEECGLGKYETVSLTCRRLHEHGYVPVEARKRPSLYVGMHYAEDTEESA